MRLHVDRFECLQVLGGVWFVGLGDSESKTLEYVPKVPLQRLERSVGENAQHKVARLQPLSAVLCAVVHGDELLHLCRGKEALVFITHAHHQRFVDLPLALLVSDEGIELLLSIWVSEVLVQALESKKRVAEQRTKCYNRVP